MHSRYILKKDHLVPFLRRLAKDCRLVAPLRNRFGDTLYSEVEAVDSAPLDLAAQPQGSVKPFLFPQQEVLFTYRTDAGGYAFTPTAPGQPTIFFGLRSCDLAAILYMDVIFQSGRDPYYLARRRDTVLIGLGCNEPFANCFCSATRSGPFLEFGFDLQFTDLGDRYYVETGRARGKEIIRRWQLFFPAATEEDFRAQYQISLEARGMFKRQVPVEMAIRRLAAGEVDDELWRKFSARCQDCGGCAYLCPTCTCFTVSDQATGPGTGERLRSWDACTFAGFTRMAGGHNPVDPCRHKVRKRFQHKLLHDVRKHGRPSCVGCGRCVGMCFGGVDMMSFVTAVCNGGE